MSAIYGQVPTLGELNQTGDVSTVFEIHDGIPVRVKVVVLNKATFITEVGPLTVEYGQVKRVGNDETTLKGVQTRIGFCSCRSENPTIVILVDLIREYYAKQPDSVFNREFGHINREGAIDAVINAVTYHELDHAIRALAGEDAGSESLADLTGRIFTGPATRSWAPPCTHHAPTRSALSRTSTSISSSTRTSLIAVRCVTRWARMSASSIG